MPSSSGRTAVESTTVESVKSKPAVAPATAEPNAVAPVVATQAEAAARRSNSSSSSSGVEQRDAVRERDTHALADAEGLSQHRQDGVDLLVYPQRRYLVVRCPLQVDEHQPGEGSSAGCVTTLPCLLVGAPSASASEASASASSASAQALKLGFDPTLLCRRAAGEFEPAGRVPDDQLDHCL